MCHKCNIKGNGVYRIAKECILEICISLNYVISVVLNLQIHMIKSIFSNVTSNTLPALLVFLFFQDPEYISESILAAFTSPVLADPYCDVLHCTDIPR